MKIATTVFFALLANVLGSTTNEFDDFGSGRDLKGKGGSKGGSKGKSKKGCESIKFSVLTDDVPVNATSYEVDIYQKTSGGTKTTGTLIQANLGCLSTGALVSQNTFCLYRRIATVSFPHNARARSPF